MKKQTKKCPESPFVWTGTIDCKPPPLYSFMFLNLQWTEPLGTWKSLLSVHFSVCLSRGCLAVCSWIRCPFVLSTPRGLEAFLLPKHPQVCSTYSDSFISDSLTSHQHLQGNAIVLKAGIFPKWTRTCGWRGHRCVAIQAFYFSQTLKMQSLNTDHIIYPRS